MYLKGLENELIPDVDTSLNYLSLYLAAFHFL